MRKTRTSGIALLLTVGILTMLALAGAALAAMAGQVRAGSALQLDRTAARLLARAGIEYASARLFQDTRTPAAPTAANQPDDWTFRDDPATPLEKTRNPSYAQTEPYLDLNANGRYDEGLDTLPPAGDWNKNGALDAWSGRLRSRYGSAEGRFILEVSADSSRISLNGGALDLGDVNRNKIPDAWDLGERFSPGGSGSGLWRPHYDEIAYRNLRLADLIDRLALALGAAGNAGERLIRGRPPGGYRSLDEAGTRVPSGDWSLLRPYLRVATEERIPAGNALLCSTPSTDSSLLLNWPVVEDPRSPVGLSRAPLPVLQALFQDLLCYDFLEAVDLGEKGVQTGRNVAMIATKFTFLTQEDAVRVAGFLALRRPFASRLELYRTMNAAKGSLFPDAPAPKNDLKLDLVCAAADTDDLGVWTEHWRIPPFSWTSYDLDRGAGPYGYGSSATTLANLLAFPKNTLRRRRLPKMAIWTKRRGEPIGTSPAGDSLHAYEGFGSLETTLLDPSDFAIASLGRSASVSSRLTAAAGPLRHLSVHTQEDFENLAGSARAAPGASKTSKPKPDRIISYPRFSLESCPDLKGQASLLDFKALSQPPWPERLTSAPVPGYRYSPFTGDLRLMHRADPAPAKAVFYAPCWENGQPFREPAESPTAADNFRDVAGGLPYLGDPRVLLEHYGTLGGWNGKPLSVPAIPGAVPGTGYSLVEALVYSWEDRLPMADADGVLRKGALECWLVPGPASGPDLQMIGNANAPVKRFELTSMGVDVLFWIQRDPNGTVLSAAAIPIVTPLPDWHHFLVSMESPRAALYLDGLPAGATGFEEVPDNPSERPHPLLLCGLMGSIVLHQDPLDPPRAMQRALAGRYWTPDPAADPPVVNGHDLRTPPSFTSPLYAFDRAIDITGARWDGFVPKAIEQATDAWNLENPGQGKIPLRVTVIAWATPNGSGHSREHGLPEAFWRQGGGWEDFEIRGVRSLKYKVEMDAGALDGTRETPVLDSISIGYKTGGRLASFFEE